jgi:hypothetical protein
MVNLIVSPATLRSGFVHDVNWAATEIVEGNFGGFDSEAMINRGKQVAHVAGALEPIFITLVAVTEDAPSRCRR